MKSSRLTKAQTIRPCGGPNNMGSLAPIFSITQDQYQSQISVWLRDEVGSLQSPTKTLAEVAGSSVAAAKHWYASEATPNGIYMSRLRAAYPNFDAKMRELEGKQRDLADDFTQALNTTFITYLRTNPEMAQAMYEQFFKHHNVQAAE